MEFLQLYLTEHGGNYFHYDGRMMNITQGNTTQGSYKNLKCVIFKNEGGNMSSSQLQSQLYLDDLNN